MKLKDGLILNTMLKNPTQRTGTIPSYTTGNCVSAPPEINIGCVANMFVRQMHFKTAGSVEQGHEHNFDHLTLLANGKLIIEIGKNSTIYSAPAMIYINKDITHKLIALEDNTVAYCIHGLRDLNVSEDIISPDMIPNGSFISELAHQIIRK